MFDFITSLKLENGETSDFVSSFEPKLQEANKDTSLAEFLMPIWIILVTFGTVRVMLKNCNNAINMQSHERSFDRQIFMHEAYWPLAHLLSFPV